MLATDFLPVLANSLLNIHPLAKVLATGMVSPLPQLAYTMGVVPNALSTMSLARHVSKVVVNLRSAQGSRSGGLYVLSGGLGSLGLLTAEWLAPYESAPLWLLGRSGRVSDSDGTLRRLWQGCACITARRCDSSSSAEGIQPECWSATMSRCVWSPCTPQRTNALETPARTGRNWPCTHAPR
jgi:hypothetical protein